MTNIPGTKIYTVTVALDSGADYEYKYTIGNWTQQETLATTLPCTKTTSGYTNRTLRTGTKDDSTIAVCWQACTLCTGSGIDKKDETRIQVYPNPASQTVHLNLGGFASQVKSIRIYNTLGEQISAGTSLNADNNNVIDVDIRSLKPGIYMAKFEMGENTQVVKFQVN